MKKTGLEYYTEEKAIAFLKSRGYQISTKEKILVHSQEEIKERYPIDFLHKHLYYNDMPINEPARKDIIDTFFHYLHNAVNTTKDTIRVNGEDKPREAVISTLLKLEYFDFLYAVEKYKENITKVSNHGAYILTLLYNAKAQHEADITNQVQHDLYS